MSRPDCCLCHDTGTTEGCPCCGRVSPRYTSPITLANRLLEEWFPGRMAGMAGGPGGDTYQVRVSLDGRCVLTLNAPTKALAVRAALRDIHRFAADEGLELPAGGLAA